MQTGCRATSRASGFSRKAAMKRRVRFGTMTSPRACPRTPRTSSSARFMNNSRSHFSNSHRAKTAPGKRANNLILFAETGPSLHSPPAMAHIHEKIDFTVAVFIVQDARVLLVHHRKLNKWLPIGGHIELEEDPEQAALREAQE